MSRRNTILSLLLSLCIILAGVSTSSASTNMSMANQPSIDNTTKSILSTTVYLKKYSSNSLYYRVTATSASGTSSSITANIVLQKQESGKWVDKKPITHTVYNAHELDVEGTISVSTYGSGNYRIMVNFSEVYNGITTKVGPIYSDTVVI